MELEDLDECYKVIVSGNLVGDCERGWKDWVELEILVEKKWKFEE